MNGQFCYAILLMFLCSAISPSVRAQSEREASADEYKVYDAVLGLMDHMPKDDLHVTIFNVTLNSKCGEDANPLPLANGCSFLWMKPDTASSVKKLLRGEWADMESPTWEDFEKENAASAHLQEPIRTPWKHKLIGPGDEPGKDWESPDLAIFLSRVGFNQKKTEAVVYVLMFSYLNQVATAGDYFLFRKNKTNQWEPKGRMTYFSKDQSSQQVERSGLESFNPIQ